MFLFIDLDRTIIDGHTNNIIFDAIEKDPSLENDEKRQWELVEGLPLIGSADEWQKEIIRLIKDDNFVCLVSFSAYPNIGKRILEKKIGLKEIIDQIPIVSFPPKNPNKDNKNKHIEIGLEALAEQFLRRIEKPHEITEKEKNICKQFYILLTYSASQIAEKFEFAKEWMTQKEKTTLYNLEEAFVAPIHYLKEVILVDDDTKRNIKGAKEAHYRTIIATKDGEHLKQMSTLKPYRQSLEHALAKEKAKFFNYSSFEDEHVEDLLEAIQENNADKIDKVLLRSISKNYETNVDEQSDDEDCEDYTSSAVKFLRRRRDRANLSLEEMPKIKAHIESIRGIIEKYSTDEKESKEKRKHETADEERSPKKIKTDSPETLIAQQNIFVNNNTPNQTQVFDTKTLEMKPNG